MKKNLMLAAMVFAMAGTADLPTSYSTTNVMDWIGVDINFSNVSNLPHQVSSTPGDAFLGFLRTFITGDIDAYAFHLSPLRRIQQIGTENLAAIPVGYRNRYLSYSFDTNICIKTFCVTKTNIVSLKVTYVLEEVLEGERMESEYSEELVFTNGEWKIEGCLTGDD